MFRCSKFFFQHTFRSTFVHLKHRACAQIIAISGSFSEFTTYSVLSTCGGICEQNTFEFHVYFINNRRAIYMQQCDISFLNTNMSNCKLVDNISSTQRHFDTVEIDVYLRMWSIVHRPKPDVRSESAHYAAERCHARNARISTQTLTHTERACWSDSIRFFSVNILLSVDIDVGFGNSHAFPAFVRVIFVCCPYVRFLCLFSVCM